MTARRSVLFAGLAVPFLSRAAQPQQYRSVASVAELSRLRGKSGDFVRTLGYYPGEFVGGAIFGWSDHTPKRDHNGGTVIDPERTFPSRNSQIASWYLKDPKVEGVGCWVVESDEKVDATQYGVRFDGQSSTAAFQAFLLDRARTKILRMNGGTLATGSVQFSSHSSVYMENGQIVDDGSLREYDRLLCIQGVTEVSIIANNVLVEQRTNYRGGEYRHNIFIADGANKISVSGVVSKAAWGDGVYIGVTSSSFEPPSEILIDKTVCDECRRLAIAVTAVRGLTVKDSRFQRTGKGRWGMTAPGAALDVEPNFPAAVLQNINFFRCIFSDAVRQGVVISLHRLRAASPPISIFFNECKVEKNYIGILTQGCPPGVKGEVSIINTEIVEQRANGARHRDWSADGALVRYEKIRGVENNLSGGKSEKNGWSSDFVVSLEGGFPVGDVGNVTFVDCESLSSSHIRVKKAFSGFVSAGQSGRLRGIYHKGTRSRGAGNLFHYPADSSVHIEVE